MAREVGYIKRLSNQISKLFSMHLETEKIERGPLETYGSPELMQLLEN